MGEVTKASASLALEDGNSVRHHRVSRLKEQLFRVRSKVEELEKELQGLRLLADAASHFTWERALLAQDLKKAEEERDTVHEAARFACKEREGLRRACCQDNPLRCLRAGVAVLSDFVMHYQESIPSLPSLAEEYRRRYPARWLDNTIPLPPCLYDPSGPVGALSSFLSNHLSLVPDHFIDHNFPTSTG
ncbi:hypothetical protein LIER_28073 [Lithospermum erythrorhizon]|uniref:Uncharacterized protein n=1 Tax=Lithospermum erythrorhizon TaxID=34254 RepID=A0AAV3REC3_LITER